MHMTPATLELGAPLDLELAPGSRVHRLREQHWARAHHAALVFTDVKSCGEDTIAGHARDFAALLDASEPLILPDERIVGCRLAMLRDREQLNLGYYNAHYPPGHATLLRLGLPGIRDRARAMLETEADPEKRDFLRGVEIAYDAACRYVARHAELARERGLKEIAAVCDELASGAPRSFHAALQLVQFTRVFGGRGCIGRFDQWLYPFYVRDIQDEVISQDEAQELLECLFIKMNEFGDINDQGKMVEVHNDDLRNIALAGQTPDGRDACNELTYMCLEASAKLMMPEPKLNVRFFAGTPSALRLACSHVLAKGANVLSVFNDEVALPALARLRIPEEDARDYCNDGCSELIIGGKGTIQFRVHDSLTALRDAILEASAPYRTYEDLVTAFKARLAPYTSDDLPDWSAITHPFFAASIEDCLAEASPRAARYRIRGAILAEVGNAADGLAAIRRLIYEERSLTWKELVAALEADYEGYEPLRQRLLNRAPKYGNDDDAADHIAAEIAEYFCDAVHARGRNAYGPGEKLAAGLMCFGIQHKRNLPASPDGRRQGDPCANSFSPAVGMDRSGPTAVLRSVSKVDLTKASHGSVLDVALHSSVFAGREGVEKIGALIDSFLKLGCTATLQLNVIDRETLLRARAEPDRPEFRTLIVRVWGFSAVFVELTPALQDHVLSRTQHGYV